MTLPFPPDSKFAIVSLTVHSAPPEILFPLSLDGTSWALSESPFEMDATWRGWLGLRTDSFSKANLYLLVVRHSEKPGILDEESEALERQARFTYLGLAIQGVQFARTGLIVQGSCTAIDEFQVRHIGDTSRMHHLRGARSAPLDDATLVRAGLISGALEKLRSTTPRPRLWKGVRSFVSAIESRDGADRLHGFVRSLEAIVKSPQGKGKRSFSRRCQTFAGGAEVENVLAQLYDLRSAAEHLNGFDAVLAEFYPPDREHVAWRRAFQAEVLARFVYRRVLTSPRLTDLFFDDRKIDKFWAPDHARRDVIWDNEKIDLETALV